MVSYSCSQERSSNQCLQDIVDKSEVAIHKFIFQKYERRQTLTSEWQTASSICKHVAENLRRRKSITPAPNGFHQQFAAAQHQRNKNEPFFINSPTEFEQTPFCLNSSEYESVERKSRHNLAAHVYENNNDNVIADR